MPKFLSRLSVTTRKRLLHPRLSLDEIHGADRPLDLIRIGSRYGGKVIVLTPELKGGSIVSVGLGEDASFDVELAGRWGARVTILDPTPRAVEHFAELHRRIGEPSLCEYGLGGGQDPRSYDLRGISEDQVRLVRAALAERPGKLPFYAPADSSHVSHSLVDLQDTQSTGRQIEVDAMTWSELLELVDHEIALLKLDIEGAELDVLPSVVKDSPRLPRQICVEYDHINFPSIRSRRKVRATHQMLQQAGYACVSFDGDADYTYLLRR